MVVLTSFHMEVPLYETRRHASSTPNSSNNNTIYPQHLIPQHHANETATGSFLSLLSVRGVNQLKEKWSEYNQPKRLRRLVSLFVSPRGKHVAVAAGNRITILSKEDDYQEPCGSFTVGSLGCSLGTFSVGAWSEDDDILGVADDTDTLYFIKFNGEVIVEITKKHLKVSSPIIGLFSDNNLDKQKSYLFTIVTSDGSLQQIEISYGQSSSTFPKCIPNHRSHLCSNVFCFDCHHELNLFVAVHKNSGSCHLSLWHKNSSTELEQLCTLQFEGSYLKPKVYRGQLTYPKVLISPQGTFIATLDLTGCLHIFKLDKEGFTLSRFVLGNRDDSPMSDNLSNGGREYFVDCMDFTWWGDQILAIVYRNGVVMLIDILNGSKVQEEDPAYFLPVLERALKYKGCLFLLTSPSSQEIEKPSDFGSTDELQQIEWITEDKFNQSHFSRLLWCLISFTEKSVPEMYGVLISKKRYQAALDFADSHGLDKDEVLKSQWLNSNQGINEINIYLSNIKDRGFVLSECVERIGPTEDAVKALLAYGLRITDHHRFSEVDDDNSSQVWDARLARLQILQFRDRLETYLRINMGRFSVQEYSKFRVMPVNKAAVSLAESGKIGALNLLFKRHPYSLSPFMLEILAAIPETVPVQTYGQLLPGRSPPSGVTVRQDDWVECEKMVHYINASVKNHDIEIQVKTEPLVKYFIGFFWPSVDELSNWYKDRARVMDDFSGQLDNCLSFLELALRKGISELQQFHQDVLYLYQIIYSDENDGEMSFNMNLVMWEELSDYDKFKFMLKGVKEENVTEKLHNRAIPFMHEKFHKVPLIGDVTFSDSTNENLEESFLVRWLKETALENKLDVCLVVIEEGCRNFQSNVYFITEIEAVDCALQCIYLSTVTDRWSIMAAILSKLPKLHDGAIPVEKLERRLRVAEGHIEAGRLLAFYQVPKPLNFFLGAQSDEKGVKQIIRLILSKFIRRQPSRSDSEWASMWRDMQYLREKAFPFLDLEYILIEFCRGLLKAGKFSLARNYLKGTSSVALASDKAENLVIQAAREYFFSASSLSCSEIWKAKECLNLYPSSGNVKTEADIIDALTVKLPNLGVNILPLQFKQIKDPMEIVKMAITNQTRAYFHVDELIEVARLLGLRSADDISAVEEAIAREAAVSGDLQLAFDLCLVLARKGHGYVWDLCAAIARGPALENMDVDSRKQLLGFALSHCDEESIGELLHAWKDLDMQGQCETLMMSTETNSSKFSVHGSSANSLSEQTIQHILDQNGCFQEFDGTSTDNQDVHLGKIRDMLSIVAKTLAVGDQADWATCLTENGKVLSFAALQLPWLLELSRKGEYDKKFSTGKKYLNNRTQAVVTILSWLARNGFAPRDVLIASLAKSIMEPPVTEEEDIMGCSYLLNLVDAFSGVEIIEEQLKIRKDYQEISSIMNVGLAYSLLHNSGIGTDPAQRKELLRNRFKEKHASPRSDEIDKLGKVQSSFWREWKVKLEEQKRLTEHSRALEKIIPGVETERFLSGDSIYIENVVLSLIESVKFEKKHILKDILKLADTYDLNCTEVLLRYLSAVLVSDVWTNDDITVDIAGYKGEIIGNSAKTIETISTIVYPAIDGHNKLRLAYVYGLLSECYLQLENTNDLSPIVQPDHGNANLRFAHYYKVIEEECKNVSFIKNLNFKNIAGLHGLNFECFSDEVYACIEESSLSALSKMVQVLVNIFGDSLPEGFMSWQDVYKYYILSSLRALETKAKTDSSIRTPEYLQGFISKLEQSYDSCRMYIRILSQSDALGIMKQYFTVIMPLYSSYGFLPDNSSWQDCLIVLLNFWLRLTDDIKEIALEENLGETSNFNPECLMSCLKVIMKLVMEDMISPSQGWGTIYGYVNCGLSGDSAIEIYNFLKAMIFSGCGFGAIAEVFSVASSETGSASDCGTGSQDLPHFYLRILEAVLLELVNGSHENQNLYHILSSLSKLEGDLKVMQCVRHVIWERLVQFSDNLQLPSSIRVYVLELMQFISGKSIKGFSPEIQANVQPWEEWNELLYASRNSEADVDKQLPDDQKDSSSRFTNTLVALKSTQLVASISRSIEITPDDLLNADTAVSCFLRLCGEASTDLHFDALLAILEEWNGLFTTGKDGETTAKASDGENDWNNDDWDDGWESLEEVDNPEREKKEDSVSVHPLHMCWTEIFRKLINLSRFSDVLRQIDQSSLKPNALLLDEDDAKSLSQIALGIDCFLALKMALMLPYKTFQLQCLGAVEDNLKQGIPQTRSKDYELLILILSSGIITSITTDSTYGTTFSYLCYLIGNLSYQCQQALVSGNGINNSEDQENLLLLFRSIIFPNFISELVKADQHVLAGFLVTKFLHTNESLSLINIAEVSLNRYLERQLHVLQGNEFPVDKTCKTLKNTVSSLRGKLSNLIQSTLSLLSATIR